MARTPSRDVAEFVKWCEDRDIWPQREERDEDRRLVAEQSMTWVEVLYEWSSGE